MPVLGLYDDVDADYVPVPPLSERVVVGVTQVLDEKVETIEKFMIVNREKTERELHEMRKVMIMLKNVMIMLTIAFFVMTIALVVVGYVVYTMPVKIVINVPHAAAGQCSVEDDFMHDFNAFEEPLSDETLVTEHNVYQDMFQQAYVLGVSVMKSKHVGTTLAVSGPLAIFGAVAYATYLSFIGY
jgi:hypothetical protein